MTRLVHRARQRVSRLVAKWDADACHRRFIGFARQKWPQPSPPGEAVILLGLFPSNPWIFCSAYVTNFLAKKHAARIETYQFVGTVSPSLRKLYAAFGARLALGIADAAAHETRIQTQATEILAGLKTKWDVIQIAVDGVIIGDQIYDTYLRYFNEPTIRLDDPRFRDVLVEALRIFCATRDYLARTRVAAFITDDFSYLNSGIITRLMFRAGVPIYMVAFGDPFHLLKLDSVPTGRGHHPFPCPLSFSRYYAFPQMFAELGEAEKTAAIGRARTALEERLSGKFCPLVNMTGTTYAAGEGRVLDDGPEPRVLVMMHDFVDSPHGFRDILFPDFFEWITFLLERAEKTPFRWYVKPHPCTADASRAAVNRANSEIVERLRQRFPKVTFLPADTSNAQILADGIAAMFTVHGTAGHEYAYRGVPVVNCGDNPHIAYAFNLHAETLPEYERCIREADRLSVDISTRAIEEFFYMNYFFTPDRIGAPVNPIDERHFTGPNWGTRIESPAIFDELIAGATPERERGVAAYLDRFFNHPELLGSALAR